MQLSIQDKSFIKRTIVVVLAVILSLVVLRELFAFLFIKEVAGIINMDQKTMDQRRERMNLDMDQTEDKVSHAMDLMQNDIAHSVEQGQSEVKQHLKEAWEHTQAMQKKMDIDMDKMRAQMFANADRQSAAFEKYFNESIHHDPVKFSPSTADDGLRMHHEHS